MRNEIAIAFLWMGQSTKIMFSVKYFSEIFYVHEFLHALFWVNSDAMQISRFILPKTCCLSSEAKELALACFFSWNPINFFYGTLIIVHECYHQYMCYRNERFFKGWKKCADFIYYLYCTTVECLNFIGLPL